MNQNEDITKRDNPASTTLKAGCQNTVIPNSVTEIGEYAFEGCSGLTPVTIPESVEEIDECAFEDCTGLISIAIPDSVTKIVETSPSMVALD